MGAKKISSKKSKESVMDGSYALTSRHFEGMGGSEMLSGYTIPESKTKATRKLKAKA